MTITSDQIRAARALLRLPQSDVAKRAGVSVVTLRRLEDAEAGAGVASATAKSVCDVLKAAGAEFIHDGVRRRSADRAHFATLFEDLREISLRSATRLAGQDRLTEADLYDEDGLPA